MKRSSGLVLVVCMVAALGVQRAVAQVFSSALQVGTISNLLLVVPGPRISEVQVMGRDAVGDSKPTRWVLVRTNLPRQSKIAYQSTVDTNYAWIHPWDGDVEVFGAKPAMFIFSTDSPLSAPDAAPAVQEAIDELSARGGGDLRFQAGNYRFSRTVFLKPRVNPSGASGRNGFQANLAGTGETARILGQTHIEAYSTNGVLFPVFAAIGDLHYTNMLTECYANSDGDTLCYRSSGNTIRDIVFSGYQWAWGSTNQLPVAGIAISGADGVTIERCGFANIAGWGVWAHAARGLYIHGCVFRNTLEGSIFVGWTSDGEITDNIIAGNVVLYEGRTMTVSRNQIWNPSHSLLNYSGETTNIVEYGVTRAYLVERSYWSDPVNDSLYSPTKFGANAGTPVYFKGSGIPAPFVENKVYFTMNGPGTNEIRIATSPKNALAGNFVDITEAKTNGTWSLTSFRANFTALDGEEVWFNDNRIDQSYDRTVHYARVNRGSIRGNQAWEIGLNQGLQRFNRHTFDKLFVGAYLEDSAEIQVDGNLFTGGYSFTSIPEALRGTFVGIYATNSHGISASDNRFNGLRYGIFSAGTSGGVRQTGNFAARNVDRISDSTATNGVNDLDWSGIYLPGTNVVLSSEVPATLTNLTDFTLTIQLPWGTPRPIAGGDEYEPILQIGSSTNYAATNFPASALALTMYSQAGSNTTQLVVSHEVAGNSRRRAVVQVSEERAYSMPMEIVITRTNGTWSIYRNGILSALGMNASGGTPPATTDPIHARFITLGVWPINLYRNGWVGSVSLHKKAFTYKQIRDGYHQSGGPSLVFDWDFRGDAGVTVKDKSGNGIDGAVISLDGTSHSFGPGTVSLGSGSGFTDGDKGDVTVASSGASITIDAGAITTNKLSTAAHAALRSGDFTGSILTADAARRNLTALGAGTVLTVNKHYTVTLSADRTVTFSGTPADGDEIGLYVTASSGVTLTFPASVDGSGGGGITNLYLVTGRHELSWTRKASEWVFLGTGLQTAFDGSAAGLQFAATNAAGVRTYSVSVTNAATLRTAADAQQADADLTTLASAGEAGSRKFMRDASPVAALDLVPSAGTNIVVDFNWSAATYAVTNNVFLVQSTNRPAASTNAAFTTLRLVGDSVDRTLGWHASWKRLGTNITTIPANKTVLLSAMVMGSAESGVVIGIAKEE